MGDDKEDIIPRENSEEQPAKEENQASNQVSETSEKQPEEQKQEDQKNKEKKPEKKHWIRPKWLRITLKTIMWFIIVIIILPFLIYVPPVQTLIKNIACHVVKNSTGIDITIDKFRLKWPLDVSLNGVTVVEASGDTMVYAKEVIADVKLMPLFKLDVDVNKLQLVDAGFNMLSPDSSMRMKLKAGFLEVDDKTSVDIKTMDINLNKVYLKNGSLSLFMDVWKQKQEPDTAPPTPLKIRMKEVKLDNFTFAMSMLPTIDTLNLHTNSIVLRNGLVDLAKNIVTADYIGTSDGEVTFITPTPEYIASHPAPVDTIPSNSPPMIIKGDTINVSAFKALYAVKDAKPLPGFDPSYIQVNDVNITLHDFFNEATDIKLPITSVTAKERSGLEVVAGSGIFAMDSTGMTLKDFDIKTPFSQIYASADIPNALMELKPWAEVNVTADGSIGMPDVEYFMPDLKTYLSKLPSRIPLDFNLEAGGTLENLLVDRLDVRMPSIFDINASGYAANIFEFKQLDAKINLNGNVSNPGIIDKFIGSKEFKLPKLALKGVFTAKNETYAADFTLKTPLGNVAADGKVNLNAESYKAEVKINNLNVASFMPDLGIGTLSANLNAQGAGFNPTKPKSSTDIKLDIPTIEYNKLILKDITANVSLHDGKYNIVLESPNNMAKIDLKGEGTLAPDLYTTDLTLILGNLDMQALGLSKDDMGGSGVIELKGSASPDQWLYDIDLQVRGINVQTPDMSFDFPGNIDFKFKSTKTDVSACLYANRTDLDFSSPRNLKSLVQSFEVVGDSIGRQIARRDLNIEWLQHALPPFNLDFNASGYGLLGDYLGSMGLGVDTVYMHLANDSIITGNIGALEISNGSMRADTLTLNLHQRGSLLDFKAHMGNQENNPIGDFADVNVNGYIGQNRLMAGLWQKNQNGETGYRLGLTAAFVDSSVTLHFTPLKATIGYIPWTFNDDNHIDINLKNFRIDADLTAQSPKSSILIQTRPGESGNDELHIALDNIQVQDFLQLSVFAPPITASLSANLNLGQKDKWLYGTGSIGVKDFTYDKRKVGDFDLGFRAGVQEGGTTGARLNLKVNNKEAMELKALLVPDSTGLPQVKKLGLDITGFPLDIANAFLGPDLMKLSGFLNGSFDLSGTFKQPKLNGYLACESVGVYIPMMGSSIKFNQDSITVKDNIIAFNDFDIWGANSNPITLNGTVDATKLTDIMFDLQMNADNFQLINNDSKAKSDLYGKLFFNLNASARGPMRHFNVNANLQVLNTTNVTYSIPMLDAQLRSHDTSGIVRFVNFNDTTTHLKKDTVESSIGMRILAGLTLDPGMQVNVIYPGSATTGNAKVELTPHGHLNYFQNYMGDMRLNGELYLGSGFARYTMPIVGEKKFVFNPESYVRFSGDLMNPSFNIEATDEVKASVIENNNSHIVNFLVEVDISNTLQNPKIEFDLNTEEDMTIRNELMSMTPDQRSMAALNMLLTGQYSGTGVKTAGTDLLMGSMYSLLTSQINGWLANNVKGVDINLGVDQYDSMINGESGTSTSYSYSVSKSLFHNKFKISVGGNYSTDASADENFSENLISDITFEYILKQTTNVTMYATLFRHTGYESILEGEITETGVGFLLRRRLANLKDLFRWGSGKNNYPMIPGMGQRNDSIKNGTPPVLPMPGFTPPGAPGNVNDTTSKTRGNENK